MGSHVATIHQSGKGVLMTTEDVEHIVKLLQGIQQNLDGIVNGEVSWISIVLCILLVGGILTMWTGERERKQMKEQLERIEQKLDQTRQCNSTH